VFIALALAVIAAGAARVSKPLAAGRREARPAGPGGLLGGSGPSLDYGWGSLRRPPGQAPTDPERNVVTERPYVLLSCAMSVDGCLDSAGPGRLVLSGAADLDRVDSERAGSDAIMVGAETIRRDDPRLLIRSPERRAARAARGQPEHPLGATLTTSGDLDPRARFFADAIPHPGPGPARLVYCAGPAAEATGADRGWLGEAIGLSRRCPPSATAFAVGAVVIAGDGAVLATGYSREGGPHDHAEEAALAKLDPADPRLGGATLFSSLEPCRFRASRPRPCAELIIAAGLRRVVIAWLEPPVFAPGGGAALLRGAGITVVEIPGLAAQARAVNVGVLGGPPGQDPPPP
jgi:pyrimidine deaminase RibD-like protein